LGIRITTVLLDFGAVLGLPQDPVRVISMAALCGLSREQFLSAYGQDRLELDRGTLPAHDYWARLMSLGGVIPTPGLVERLEREDALGWTRINRSMVAWAAELRAAGYRTAILSNMPPEKLAFMRASASFSWIDDFDAVFFSCDYRMVKPEPAFYQVCLTTLGVTGGECLFLDDSPLNAEGARAAGINALVFRSAREAAAALDPAWGLPVRSLLDGEGAGEVTPGA
jgi:putative hydrolase of the HAD superfamily